MKCARCGKTYVFGVPAVYQAMLPLLREAPAARIVSVSSGAGSLTMNSDPANAHRSIFGPVYPASKTALNAMTLAGQPNSISKPMQSCKRYTYFR